MAKLENLKFIYIVNYKFRVTTLVKLKMKFNVSAK